MKESFGRKMLSILIVLAMLATAFVMTNTFVPTVKAYPPATIPGYNDWGNATTELLYSPDTATAVTINTTGLTIGTPYHIYKPLYNSSGGPTSFSWETTGVKVANILSTITPDATGFATFSPELVLDRAGMWVIDNNDLHDGSDGPSFLSSVPAFIWVNSTPSYTISGVDDSFEFGSVSTQSIEVATGGETYICIDLFNKDTNTKIFHMPSDLDGKLTFDVDGTWHNITTAGNYTIRAYKDLDGSTYYQYGSWGYNSTHNFSGIGGYNYSTVGPWDPPEHNATDFDFEVTTNERTDGATIAATNITNVYWGHELRIDVNVTAPNQTGITGGNITLTNTSGNCYLDDGDINLTITEVSNGNYTIEIERYSGIGASIWDTLGNHSWWIVFSKNDNAATWEEWNNSKKFRVESVSPPVRLVITNDGDGDVDDMKVDIPAFAGPATVTPIDIAFTIYGTQLSGEREYYGDSAGEDEYNITVTGDILYPADLTYVGPDGEWTASVIPTKPSGTISIWVDWPGSDNGSTTPQTINIINGTVVTVSTDYFLVGADISLTVTVKDMWGNPVINSAVYLIWKDPAAAWLNSTNGTNADGNGKNGEYSFLITALEQGGTAPRNITIAAKTTFLPEDFWGYATVEMKKNNNLWVNCSPTTAYAGDAQEYDIEVLMDGTTVPAKYSDITIALYKDEELVTTLTNDNYKLTGEEIILGKGTYTVFSYNDTYSSEDHNATITVTPYAVTCSPTVLAWLIDTETNVTFQITPSVNGTLRLNNMSSAPNCSDTTTYEEIDIEDGIGALDAVDATDLGNVTFKFKPEGGESEEAEGLLRVTTATATPSPATIYIGESTNVVITVTHPASPYDEIPDVTIGLDQGLALNETILSKLPTAVQTDANGQAVFAITAEASGEVTIYVNNETDPDNPFVITAAARKTMVITTDTPSVNEKDDSFTIFVKDNDGNLITDSIAVEFNGTTYTVKGGSVAIDDIPSVETTLPYPITASAEGYTDASATITVVNVPQIYMTVPSTATKGEKFTIKVAADNGNGNGITVTLTKGETAYTAVSVDSIAEFTVDAIGTYTITATKTGCSPATLVDGIKVNEKSPGFELLTLIIAIGVAFILLRRRQK